MIFKIRKNKIKIVLLLALAFIIVITPLPFIISSDSDTQPYQEQLPKTAQSQVATIKPENDIQTSWYTATPHWNKLDECGDESDPTDSNYVTANSGDHDEIEIFSIENSLQYVESVSQIKIHTYGRSYGNSNPKVSIFWNGEWAAWQTVNIPRSAMPGPLASAWTVNTFIIDGFQSDLNNLQVRYKAQCTGWIWSPFGTINIGSNSLGAFFCEVTYETNTIISDICRSSEDVTNQWLWNPLPHWNRLNEYVVDPESGDSNGILARSSDHNEIEEFEMDNNIQFVSEVSQIEVHTYGRSYGNSNPKVSIFWNGEWTAWQTVNIPRSAMPGPLSAGWATNTWVLTGDQFDVNEIRVRYKAQCTGWIWSPFGNINIGSNSIYTTYCKITYEPLEPTIDIIGGSQINFPLEQDSKLGFSIYTISAVDPRIQFKIKDELATPETVTINVKIDGEEIFNKDLDISSTFETELIHAYNLQDNKRTHQIVIELGEFNGNYELEYIKIYDIAFQQIQFNSEDELYYVPVELTSYGYEKDFAVVTFNVQVPYSDDGILNEYVAAFTPSIVLYIDPGHNGPNEYLDFSGLFQGEGIRYVHSASMNFRVLGPDGVYVEHGRFSLPFGIRPSISQQTEYSEINRILEYINLMINLLPLPDYLDALFDLLDIYLTFLPDHTPASAVDGTIEPDTGFASWTTGYDWTIYGYLPNPQFDDKFSMRVNWAMNLPTVNPPAGSYQVEITWSFVIYMFEWRYQYFGYPFYNYVLSYHIRDDLAFTISETSYINFIYDP